MTRYTAEPLVDAYIQSLPEWQQLICQRVRELAHQADEEVQEVIKRRVQPYFVMDGNICALLAAKTHVNIFIYDPTVPDLEGIINQGHNNLTAKSIQVFEGQALNDPALLVMLRTVVNNNRAGGWRAIQKRSTSS